MWRCIELMGSTSRRVLLGWEHKWRGYLTAAPFPPSAISSCSCTWELPTGQYDKGVRAMQQRLVAGSGVAVIVDSQIAEIGS